jgi:hypothetical protein
MGLCRLVLAAGVCLYAGSSVPAQIVQFESGGLKYQTLTKNGFTIMVAPLPRQIHDYSIFQVAVSNGTPIAWSIRPEDFTFERSDGAILHASPANQVVDSLIARAKRGDIIKLITAYESGLYGLQKFKSTNGYESRRQDALAFGSGKIKAAAAASAIAFVRTRLDPGDSTDGAIFYATQGKPLGPGKLVVDAAGEKFEFYPDATVSGTTR